MVLESGFVRSVEDCDDEHLSHEDDAPCMQVRHLVSGLPRRLRANRWFVVVKPRILQIGLDESGYGQTGPHEAFVFAGYAAPVRYMENFTHRWDSIMREEPPMTVHELKKRVRWRQKTDPRVLQMIHTIGESELKGVRFKISDDEYKAMIADVAVRDSLPRPTPRLFADNSYFFAFMAIFLRLMTGMRSEPNVKFEVIYDANMSERSKMEIGYKLFYELLQKNHPEFVAMIAKDPIPQSDEDFTPLQAADALAWHSHRDHVEGSNGREYANEMWNALENIPFLIDLPWTRNDLLQLFQGNN
jgi:Protein of unknown function (DUF3800)